MNSPQQNHKQSHTHTHTSGGHVAFQSALGGAVGAPWSLLDVDMTNHQQLQSSQLVDMQVLLHGEYKNKHIYIYIYTYEFHTPGGNGEALDFEANPFNNKRKQGHHCRPKPSISDQQRVGP